MALSLVRNSVLFIFGVAAIGLLAPTSGLSQTAAAGTPSALTVVNNALSASGASAAMNYQDAKATGTLVVPGNDPIPLTIEALGRNATRVEASLKDGTAVRIVNSGKGTFTRPDGNVRVLNPLNLVAERVNYIPALSFLADAPLPKMAVTYTGTDTVNGSPADVVSVAVASGPDDAQVAASIEVTRHRYFIDGKTQLVVKVQYTHFAEDGSPGQAEVIYDDYRLVSGMAIPFRQTTYIDGSLFSDLTLQSVSFNVGLSPSDFVVPEVKQ